MSKLMLRLGALIALSFVLFAQAPTGSISGTMTDESGAVIPNATVNIVAKGTGFSRTALTNSEGFFSAPALPAGEYEVRAEAQGFRTTVREATVQAGSSTTVNLPMQLGGTKDVVTVEAATAQINYDTHNIQGVIQQENIQDLPLNGRSFMQLAKLEPGVTIANGSTAQFNALFTVSVLGAGNRTAFSIDGGNVSDTVDTFGGISSMNFSQETVQEFQLSSVNFDLATPIAAGGAINVVTRSGSNAFHGSGYFFFRDHNMAAYPNLKRNPLAPDPFFARRNPGVWVGGPIKKDKIFFFTNYEYTNQVQAVTVQGTVPSVQPLTGTYGSPYIGKLFSFRVDDRLTAKHTAFFRYSHDGNSGFGTSLTNGDPSNWVRNTNWADQAIIGVTSVLTPALVNDLRAQFNYWNNHNYQAVASDCSGPCVAGSLPSVVSIIGANFGAVGPNFNAPQARNSRRYEVNDSLSWQVGKHRMKFGGGVNRVVSAGLWGFCTPFCANVVSPETLLGIFQPIYGAATMAALFPTLPTKLTSDRDVLNLPVYNTPSSIFSGIGVGFTSTPAPYNSDQNKASTQYRAYFQDTWKILPNFTLNFGLAWDAQTGYYNSDLAKPQYLSPILGTGSNVLGATVNNTKEFQPAFGFAWTPKKNGKTVIRGGGGIYWDQTPFYYKLREAPVIGPVGDGRSTLAASAFTNIFPGAFNLSTGKPIAVGDAIPLNSFTNLTLGQFQQIVNQQVPAIAAKLTPTPPTSGPYSVSGIDVAKQGVEIYPTHFPLTRSYQLSIGLQRDIGHGMVLTADYARRQGVNVSEGEIDMNLTTRFLGTSTPVPVIPACTTSQLYVPGQECSTGSITFWTDEGRAIYNGLLVKLAKRFEKHYQFVASYALQRATTTTVWDNTNWMAGYGQYLPHHNLTVAGTVDLPWGFQLSLNSTYISKTPVVPSVSGLDLPGTVPSGGSEPLPGVGYSCFNAGCGASDLAAAVNNYNTNVAGTKDAKGSTIGQLALPSSYQFGDSTISQDFRLTKKFTFKEHYTLSILGEMFNTFNIANLTGYSFTLDAKGTTAFNFGQPTQRAAQTFGSGGPRAFQLGARFVF